MLFGKLREPERGAAECVVGGGRFAGASPHGPDDAGGEPRGERGAVYGEIPRVARPLWYFSRGDESGVRSRERRLRARTSAFQGGRGASVAAAWQPGFRESGGILAIRAGLGGATKRVSAGEVCRGANAAASVAGAAAGDPGAAVGACGPGEHHPGKEEHVLGACATEGRARGSTHRRRRDRGVVRRRARADDGAVAWPGQAPNRLSARDRLVGAETGGVCAVRVPRGSVPERDVSASLRRAGGATACACGPGVRSAAVPGVEGGGESGRGGAGASAGAVPAGERAGGADAAGQ